MEMKIGPIKKSVVVRTDECKERLALLFEKGLKSPLGCNETIIMRHDELQSIFPGLPIQFFRLNFPRRRVKNRMLPQARTGNFCLFCEKSVISSVN